MCLCQQHTSIHIHAQTINMCSNPRYILVELFLPEMFKKSRKTQFLNSVSSQAPSLICGSQKSILPFSDQRVFLFSHVCILAWRRENFLIQRYFFFLFSFVFEAPRTEQLNFYIINQWAALSSFLCSKYASYLIRPCSWVSEWDSHDHFLLI